MGKNAFDFLAPILGTVAGSLIGNPELGFLPELGTAGGAALGTGIASGIDTGVKTGNPLAGLTSGAISGAGSYLGSNLLGGIGAGAGSGAGSVAASAPLAGTASSLLSVPGQSATDAFLGNSSTGLGGDFLFNGGNFGVNGIGDSVTNAALSGAGSGAGSSAASSGVGGMLQTPMSGLISQGLGGGSVGDSVGSLAGSANVGNAVGGLIGNDLGQQGAESIYSHFGSMKPNNINPDTGMPYPAPSAGGMALPSDLSNISGLTPDQQLSNISTQGVYGGGSSVPDEQYFLNQLGNQLTTGQGQYSPMSSISPINMSMLSRLGLGGMNNTPDLLTAMQGWQPPTT